MKLNIEELAKQAGATLIDPSFRGSDFAISARQIEVFARLIVERCAMECENQSQEYEQYTGQTRLLQYQCAEAVRELLEDE
jgi:hypothetical protein